MNDGQGGKSCLVSIDNKSCDGKGVCYMEVFGRRCLMKPPIFNPNEQVNHPAHYGGEDNTYEAIKVIEAWGLGFCLGNAVEYISRAGKKDPAKIVEDLEKARWYLDREIANLKTPKIKIIPQFGIRKPDEN